MLLVSHQVKNEFNDTIFRHCRVQLNIYADNGSGLSDETPTPPVIIYKRPENATWSGQIRHLEIQINLATVHWRDQSLLHSNYKYIYSRLPMFEHLQTVEVSWKRHLQDRTVKRGRRIWREGLAREN